MKFIIGSRGSGVTTDILIEASQFDRPVIVPTEANKHHIKDECLRLGIICPEVYTFVNAWLEWTLKEYGFMGKIGTVSASLEVNYD